MGEVPSVARSVEEEIEVPAEIRDRLALALDVDDLVAATRMARELRPWFSVAKVGLELFSAAGPDAIESMLQLGYVVFADLKLHDIPTTVARSAKVLGSLGATYVTMHAHGGTAMLRAGVDGLAEGSAAAGHEPGIAVAVTVLTSDTTAPPHIMPKRAALAAESGCRGIVCAVTDLREARGSRPGSRGSSRGFDLRRRRRTTRVGSGLRVRRSRKVPTSS